MLKEWSHPGRLRCLRKGCQLPQVCSVLHNQEDIITRRQNYPVSFFDYMLQMFVCFLFVFLKCWKWWRCFTTAQPCRYKVCFLQCLQHICNTDPTAPQTGHQLTTCINNLHAVEASADLWILQSYQVVKFWHLARAQTFSKHINHKTLKSGWCRLSHINGSATLQQV